MANDLTRTHRCSHCDQDWPYTTQYKECPICGNETFSTTTDEIVTHARAEAVIKEHQAEIDRREEIERKMDEALVNAATQNMDEWLSSLLC